MPENRCIWTVVLEKTLESPLDSKGIKPVNLKGDQPWIFTGRADVEAEAPVFWSSDANKCLIGKVSEAGKDWGQKEKRASEDEMAGWHHWCSERERGQNLGDGEGQGGLAGCSPWGCKELDTVEWLNNNNKDYIKLWLQKEGILRELCPTVNLFFSIIFHILFLHKIMIMSVLFHFLEYAMPQSNLVCILIDFWMISFSFTS